MRLSLESQLRKLRSFPDPPPCWTERKGEFRSVPPGSKEHARGGEEGFAGTWEILSSPRIFFGGAWVAAFKNPPALRCRVGDRTGAKQPAQPWYRQAKEDEARREGWREVLAPHSTDEAGTVSIEDDPAEGRRTPEHGTVFRNYDGCIGIRRTYQRNRNG